VADFRDRGYTPSAGQLHTLAVLVAAQAWLNFLPGGGGGALVLSGSNGPERFDWNKLNCSTARCCMSAAAVLLANCCRSGSPGLGGFECLMAWASNSPPSRPSLVPCKTASTRPVVLNARLRRDRDATAGFGGGPLGGSLPAGGAAGLAINRWRRHARELLL